MGEFPESMFSRPKGFFFEKNATLRWRVRLRRAGTYAGLVWVLLLVGAIVLKYTLHLVDRPILTVIAQSSILPLLLFGCFIYGYRQADVAKRLYEQRDREHEKA